MEQWLIKHIDVLSHQLDLPMDRRGVHVHMTEMWCTFGAAQALVEPAFNVMLFSIGNESDMELKLEVIGYLNHFVLPAYGRYTSLQGVEE